MPCLLHFRFVRTLTLAVVAAALSSCGGGSHEAPIPANAVAEVKGQPITKADLNHWMATLAGVDFYEITRQAGPRHLVSDPPRYSVCVAALRSIQPRHATHPHSFTATQLRTKCRQLNRVLEEETVSYLIFGHWAADEGAEEALAVSGQEVKQKFASIKAEQFPTEAQLRRYLALRGLDLADELSIVRREVLSTKLLQTRTQKVTAAGGPQSLLAAERGTTARLRGTTSCRAGYVVPQCRQDKTPNAAPVGPSAAVLIEELAGLR